MHPAVQARPLGVTLIPPSPSFIQTLDFTDSVSLPSHCLSSGLILFCGLEIVIASNMGSLKVNETNFTF